MISANRVTASNLRARSLSRPDKPSHRRRVGALATLVAVLTVTLTSACGPKGGPNPPNQASSAPTATEPNQPLRTFIEPMTGDHFSQPAGAGTLRICRSPDNSVRDAAPIDAGTTFSDVGVIDQPPERSGGWWLLWVRTTQAVTLPAGQDCITAAARVVPSEVPSNYSDMQSLTRFSVADRRYFEILSDGGNLDHHPALLLMSATAQTDFQ